jgi:serine/threonine-protein kinase
VKLVDLGLARRYESQGQLDLTQTGTTLGTFDYISPEQARDPRNVDIRSDLYSLGCTMFHMLTGTPPFPGQNVVQKLLQHQEKAAPDIRALNPDVPDSLADLIARLMSKSPSDRPASAESCVRELESIRSEMAMWASVEGLDVEPNTIRGLLSWLIPASILTAAITVGSWLASDYGQTGSDKAPNGQEPVATTGSTPPEKEAQPDTVVPRAIVADATLRKPPTTYRAKDGASLALALKESSPGSVIILSESARYEVKASELPDLDKTDLTLRGESGTRPTIVAAIPGPDEIAANSAVSGLIRMRDSRVTIQNVAFDLGAATGTWLDAAVYAENSDLTLRDVLFVGDASTNKTAGRFVRFGKSDFRENSAWRPLRVENCRFLGNRAAIAGKGSLDISVYDSAMLGSEPLIEIDETDRETPWPCIIRIEHSNFQATAWTPVLSLGNVAASLRVRNCVFAPKPGVQMILLSSRRPSRVDWFGRENLFGDLASFLESPRVEEEIVDFTDWTSSETTIREQSSQSTNRFVYWPVESVVLAKEGRWADAFAMNPGPWSDISVGIRAWANQPGKLRVPAAVPNVAVAANETKVGSEIERSAHTGVQPGGGEKPLQEGPVAVNLQNDPRDEIPIEPTPMPMPMQNEPAEEATGSKKDPVNDKGNPVVAGETGKSATGRNDQAADVVTVVRPDDAGSKLTDARPLTGTEPKRTDPVPGTDPAVNALGQIIRNTDEFRKALKEPGKAQGSTITLAAGAVIRIDDTLSLPDGRWLINAEPGQTRPRIVFVGQNRALVENQARWKLENAANLRLRGIDIEWDANEPNGQRLFDIATGTQIVFESCSLTSRLPRTDLQFFTATHSEEADFVDHSTARASVRLIDSVVRTSGGVIQSPGELRCELELSGTLAVVGRPLVTIQAPERLQSAQSTRVQLNQSTLVLGAGLAVIHLGRAPADKPPLEFQVRRSILAGNDKADSSLIEVLGGDPEEEIADSVGWDGDEVVYHKWSTYRMDRNDISGMLARRQNREDWQLSNNQQDHEPIHGDVDFTGGNFWSRGGKPWEAVPDEFMIRDGSPAAGIGAKIDRLPRVPNSQVPRVSSFSTDRFVP